MLTLDRPRTVLGYTVYRDDQSQELFYVVPNQPNFRLDDEGLPVFSYVEYRQPSQTVKGEPKDKLAGALCLFDVEFTVTDAEIKRVSDELLKITGRKASVNRPQYLWGSAQLLLPGGTGNPAIRITNLGKPSLVGSNVTSFNMEMSSQWAEIFKAGVDGGGGAIQVIYNLGTPARCGQLTVKIAYDVDQIRSFIEEISSNTPGSGKGFAQSVNEKFSTDRVGKIDIDFGAYDPKSSGTGPDAAATQAAIEATRKKVRDWALDTLSKQMEKELQELSGVSKEERDEFSKAAAKDAADHQITVRSPYGWFFYYYKNQPQERKSQLKNEYAKSSHFSVELHENYVIDFNIAPQGTLPAITSLKDRGGKKLDWKRFSTSLTLNRGFYEKRYFQISVQHSFGVDSPISYIEVRAHYGSFSDDRTFEEKNLSAWTIEANQEKTDEKLVYSYEVFYKNRSASFQSPRLTTADSNVILTDANLGVATLALNATMLAIRKGDCTSAQVEITHPNVKLPKQYRFVLDTGKGGSSQEESKGGKKRFDDDDASDAEKPTPGLQLLQSLALPVYIGEPKPFVCNVSYSFQDHNVWKDSVEIEGGSSLNLDYPFFRRVSILVEALTMHRAVKEVEVKVEYKDPASKYLRHTAVKLKQNDQSKEFSLGVPGDAAGEWSASGRVIYDTGQVRSFSRVLPIDGRLTIAAAAERPPAAVTETQEISIVVEAGADLWDVVRSIRNFQIKYEDPADPSYNSVMPVIKDIPADTEQLVSWDIEVGPDSFEGFSWEATFVFKDKKRAPQKVKSKSPGWVLIIDPPEIKGGGSV
ncbi:hypothetical protein [Acidicapsa acidisoli]|uniref:hypothetical protein n=1 Tax=Acidicapsa acidisoli TaxID=1615681 RepID=UPI0021DFC051|nr:hypothetical protein [Acidicapsa acidisoli]